MFIQIKIEGNWAVVTDLTTGRNRAARSNDGNRETLMNWVESTLAIMAWKDDSKFKKLEAEEPIYA